MNHHNIVEVVDVRVVNSRLIFYDDKMLLDDEFLVMN